MPINLIGIILTRKTYLNKNKLSAKITTISQVTLALIKL